MLSGSSLLALAALSAPAAALSGMATTTRYYDGSEGACGCGSSSGLFQWQTGLGSNIYTAAGSQALYDAAGSSWCGSGCGTCFQLTATGTSPPGQGAGGTQGTNITIMLTNLCPNAGNAQWCPSPGQKNEYGYEYHFDLMASSSALAPIMGDNQIVSFESVPCPGVASSDYSQCACPAGTGASGTGGSPAPSSVAPAPVASSKAASGSGGESSAAPAPAASSSAPSGSGSSPCSSKSIAAHWGQCGGEGFTGPTRCARPYTCKEQNPWYSQCL